MKADHLADLRARNLRPSTIYQRGRVLERLARHAGQEPLDCGIDEVRAYLDSIPAASSRACELSHLRQFYRWAVIHEVIAKDPTLTIGRIKQPRRLPRPINEPDLAMAVTTAPDRVLPWLLLAGWAGLRACEIAPLRAEDLWWHTEPRVIHVRESKGGGERMVALGEQLGAELRQIDLPRRGWLFPRRDGTPGPVTAHRVSQLANRHLHQLGIPLTLHSLRHRFGTEFFRACRDLRLTQEQMGHQGMGTTTLYTQVVPVEGAAVVNRLPWGQPLVFD